MLLSINTFIKQFHIYLLASQFLFHTSKNVAKALVGVNIGSASPNEYPYVVSIMTYYPDDDRPEERLHRCTGTLISAQDVLTSEHCLYSLAPMNFRLLIGSHDLRQARKYLCFWWWSYNYWARQRHIHSEFRQNDIAFVKVLGNVPDQMSYPRIPNTDTSNLFGLHVKTACWGKGNNNATSRMMQVADLRIISNDECMERIEALHGSRLWVHSRRICSVGEPYVLVQGGDSGGPVLYDNAIIAVNHGTCPSLNVQYHPDQVNVHCGIQYYRNFIIDVKHYTHTNFPDP